MSNRDRTVARPGRREPGPRHRRRRLPRAPRVDALRRARPRGLAVTSGRPSPEDRPGVRWVGCDLLAPQRASELLGARARTHLLHLAWYAEHGRVLDVAAEPRVGRGQPAPAAGVRRGGRQPRGRGRHVRRIRVGDSTDAAWKAGRHWRPRRCMAPRSTACAWLRTPTPRQEGLSLAWGRVFFTFGPGEPAGRLVPSVARALLEARRRRSPTARRSATSSRSTSWATRSRRCWTAP